MGPFEDAINWSTEGLEGCYRFLKRVWNLFQMENKIGKATTKNLVQKIHYTIKKIGDDLENMKFNTAVSTMMEFINSWSEKDNILSKKDAENFLKILAPLAPHIAEELYQQSKSQKSKVKSIFEEKWPKYDEKLIKKEKFDLIIQINGKVRDKVEVDAEIPEDDAKKIALGREKIKIWLKNQEPKKMIFIKGKLVNIVV
jgi:leucyl-tRNA synthetase